MRVSLSTAPLLCVFLVMGSGCATVFAGGPDDVPIRSIPEGAMVLLDGVPVGETPVVVTLPREGKGRFSLELDGYEKRTVDVDKVVNGATFFNLVWAVPPFWPVLPVAFLVDFASGDYRKYPTDPVFVELRPRHGG